MSILTEIYGGNDDWPHNNVKMWKSKKNGGRWRWMLYDTDQSYNIWGRTEDSPSYDKLAKCLAEKGKNGDTWSNVLLRNMVKNTAFRNEFVNRFAEKTRAHLSDIFVDFCFPNFWSTQPIFLT